MASVAAGESTQTTNLGILQPFAFASGGINNAAHCDVSHQVDSPRPGGRTVPDGGTRIHLLSYPAGAIGGIRTHYLLFTKQPHILMCFDGWYVRQDSNL